MKREGFLPVFTSIFSFLSKQDVKNPKYKDGVFKVTREMCS